MRFAVPTLVVYHGYGEGSTVHCAIEHLARSIWANRFADRLMAMITVYFDDSGTHRESDIAVAACFVSDVRRWGLYKTSWRQLLDEFGISECGFHMADFVAHVPPFNSWSEKKREKLITALIATINKNALGGMATAVIKNDYDRFVTGKLRDKLGRHHFTFAVQGCLSQLEEWRRGFAMTQPMEYVFDATSKGKHEITDLFDDIAARNIATCFGIEPHGYAFQNRRTLVQLQSADILAWEANKYMKDCQFTGTDARRSFQSLVSNVEIRARFFDESTLPEFVAAVAAKYEAVNWNGPLGGFL